MSGDTTNLNLKAQQKNRYDVIVVGSGISGGWAAKELCEKGMKVLMLERGSPVEHPHYPTATKDPWAFEHRGALTREDKKRSFVQARHYSYRDDNKQYYINDLENPEEEVKRFDWIRGDIVGGRSLLWARQSLRMSDLDFEANAREGVGVDWPIRYRDIEPWYTYAEKFIGVSGSPEGIPHLPDGHFQPPMQMNCVEEAFSKTINRQFPDRRVIIGRTANLTAPVQGRGTCQFRNLCHRGCPYGAYFSTNASTLPAAFATRNLELRSGILVNRVLYDEKKGRATGVEALDLQSGRTEEFFADILFLNASTLGTAFILLNSTSSRFPNGLGNGSDQVGRNLMDHHKTMGLSAEVDGFEDKYYFGRRPNGLYVPRFRNVTTKRKDYLRGFGLQGGAYRHRGVPVNGEQIGPAYKESLCEAGPWSMGFTGFGECLPYAENRATLNKNKTDKWGRPQLSIDAAFRDNEHTMHKDILDSVREMFEAAGYHQIQVSEGMSFPGNSNHEMGTARMGRDPKTSVLNGFNQMHEVPNVFITDGSFMASMGFVNPSLTYMAMTARAVDYVLREKAKRNL